jgi:hypothetical protein
MHTEISGVATGVYDYFANFVLLPLCRATLLVFQAYGRKSSVISRSLRFIPGSAAMERTFTCAPSEQFWNSCAVETELLSSAGIQISQVLAELAYYN